MTDYTSVTFDMVDVKLENDTMEYSFENTLTDSEDGHGVPTLKEEIVFVDEETEVFQPSELDSESDPLYLVSSYLGGQAQPATPSFFSDSCLKSELLDHFESSQQPDSHHLPESNSSLDVLHLKCIVCDVVFPKSSVRNEHQLKHPEMVGYWCSECERLFISASKLRRHFVQHMSTKIYKCGKCEMSFAKGVQLRRHMQCHARHNTAVNRPLSPVAPKLESSISCTECNIIFASTEHLARHEKKHHKSGAVHRCGRCSYVTANKYSLVIHEQTHEETKSYNCEICSRGCATATRLRTHMLTHLKSSDKPSFPCKICGRSLSSVNNLLLHQRTHKQEWPYACSICCKAFRDISRLKDHQRQHTGEAPFPCRFCNMTFKNTGPRVRHERQMHAREHPHVCEKCDQGFLRKFEMITHTCDISSFSLKMEDAT